MRNTQIEGLRGLGCLMVLIFHIVYQYRVYVEGIIPKGPLMLLSSWGLIGVYVFLILSGFYMIEPKSDLKVSLLRFYIKKLVRIWPLYAVSVLIIYIFRMFVYVPGFEEIDCLDLILNLTMVNGFSGDAYVEPAHWYMTTLIRVIFVAGLLQAIRFHKKVWIYNIWLCLIISVKLCQRIPIGFLNKLDTIRAFSAILNITGGAYTGVFVLAFMLYRMKDINKKELLSRDYLPEKLTFCFAVIFLIALPGLWNALVAIMICLVVLGCYKGKLYFLENKIFLFFGMISYPVYLIHQYISYGIEYYLLKATDSYFQAAIAAFVVSVMLGILLYYFVEQPVDTIVKRKLRLIKG